MKIQLTAKKLIKARGWWYWSRLFSVSIFFFSNTLLYAYVERDQRKEKSRSPIPHSNLGLPPTRRVEEMRQAMGSALHHRPQNCSGGEAQEPLLRISRLRRRQVSGDPVVHRQGLVLRRMELLLWHRHHHLPGMNNLHRRWRWVLPRQLLRLRHLLHQPRRLRSKQLLRWDDLLLLSSRVFHPRCLRLRTACSEELARLAVVTSGVLVSIGWVVSSSALGRLGIPHRASKTMRPVGGW